MLTEQRYDIILKLLEEKNSITVAEVKELLNTSESTVRRDITALHNAGKLVKVFGGAVACDRTVVTHEPTVEQKSAVNVEEKQLVAAKAASLTGGFRLSRRRNHHGVYAYVSDGEECDLRDQCGSPCQSSGGGRVPCLSGRWRTKRFHRSCGRQPGIGEFTKLSFYQGIFWHQRHQQTERSDHTGYE